MSAADDSRVGIPWTGEPGVREKTSEIMAREKQFGRRTVERIHPPLRREEIELPLYPDWIEPSPASVALEKVTPKNPQTLGVNFTAATLNDCQAYPPDTMGAVGPSQFIAALNGRIRSFTKNGVADGAINVDTDVFFTSVMTPPVSNNFTSDPRIRYDRLSRRWFIIILDVPGKSGSLPNRIMLAVSDGSVITAGTVWTFFQFQQDLVSPAGDTGEFADYPTLGVDANALYIGVNVFGTRGLGSFDNTTGFVVRKSSILGVGPIVVTAFRGLVGKGHGGGPYTPQGVDNFDPAATEGYFIGVDSSYYGLADLRRVSNPGGTPSISGNVQFSIPLNGGTINVPHLGNTGGSAGNLDGLDYRLLAAVMRNGHLWTSANLAVDNNGAPNGTDSRMGVRWLELSGIPTGQTPSVVQSGTVFQPSASNTTDQRCYWMGTVTVSGQGHAAMGFSVAGANEHANAGTCGRLALDPPNTMQASVLYTASSAAYNPRDGNNNPINRWGDYSFVSVDPTDDMTMWCIQEFCDSANSYGCRVVKLLAPPPATPISCNPSSLAAGVTNTNVVVIGMLTNGAGFFDPGAGFSNRIAAAVNGGGVTVNAITFNNPSNITLNLSVAISATSGARTISVTNPDGQTATSGTGILTISGGATNHPPTLTAIPNKTVVEQTLLTFTNTASDPDGGPLTFSLDPGAPTNAAVNPTNGIFLWTPTETQGPSSNSIIVRVTDNGSLSDTKMFSVIVTESNQPPVLSFIANQTVNELTLLTFTANASDTDLPLNALTFTLDPGAPTNAALNPTNGTFSWTPSEEQGPSSNSITIRVTDNGSPPLSDTETFSIIVNEVNSPPLLTAISNQTVHAGTTLILTNSASDLDLPTNTLTFNLDPGAPTNATVGASNGIFTWTTSEADLGTNSITVRVTDNGSPLLSDPKTFNVVVVALPIFEQPTIAGEAITLTWSAIAGQKYRVQFKTDLNEAAWTDLGGDVTATGSTASKTHSIAGSPQRFYRLLVL